MGVGQVLMGTATVGATMLLADRCGFSRRVALLAGALVALDPLLIEYTTQAMTETLFTFLVNVLLLSLCRPEHARSPARVPSPDSAPSRNRVPWNDALSGLLFGLAALCRPSIWAFGLLSGVVWLVLGFRRSQTSSTTPKPAGRSFLADVVRSGIPFGLAALLILVPWVVRNFVVFSSPIVMTTHGGYTLLLGNNPTFYDEVVAGEGSRWSGDSLTAWQQRIARDLRRQDVAASDELARDNALNSRAVEWITNHPRRFLHACLFKLSRFWAVSPTAAAGIPSWLVFLVGAYYSVLFLGAVCGAVVHRRIWLRWWVLPVIVLSFSAVHSVYWSNTRMRSPVVPVVAIAAAAGSVTVWRSTKERAGNRREV